MSTPSLTPLSTVAIHHGMADKLLYACRLIRKAYRSGTSTCVMGDADTLRQLDRLLWVFDEADFVPHVCQTDGKALPPHLMSSPVWLSDGSGTVPILQAGINVGQAMPQHFTRFTKYFDLVSSSQEDKPSGRQRWREYEAMGLQIQSHPMKDD